MTTEICIEHRYPPAYAFVEHHGPDSIAILHDLITHAHERNGELVVQASIRQIAQRVPRLSKDTVYRRLRELHRAQVIRIATSRAPGQFDRPMYVLDLTGTGISVTRFRSAPT